MEASQGEDEKPKKGSVRVRTVSLAPWDNERTATIILNAGMRHGIEKGDAVTLRVKPRKGAEFKWKDSDFGTSDVPPATIRTTVKDVYPTRCKVIGTLPEKNATWSHYRSPKGKIKS
ncbi:MAG: hypothetical protein JRI25_26180 [Deltaproteobacteria bacterium]|nr:hypothetical protein [Deltaproteobacteria bacterium]MBW2258068.1 hypothetical protein [Deltaproteobacteria bacterium]